jgi:hypothetical protein
MFYRRLAKLSILGLSLIASAYASQSISGSVRIDLDAPNQPQDNSPDLLLSRTRVDIKGTLENKLYTYRVRIDRKVDGTVVMPEAKLSWKKSNLLTTNVGITTPSYSAHDMYYAPQIDAEIGVLRESNGDKVGINFNGYDDLLGLGYSAGVWKSISSPKITGVTSITSSPVFTTSEEKIRLASGARLNYVVTQSDNFALGMGASVASASLIKPMVVGYDDAGIQVITDRVSMTADTQMMKGLWQMNAAWHYCNYYGNPLSGVTNAFPSKNKAWGAYIESGYIIGSKGFVFDAANAVVGGFQMNADVPVIAISARVGMEQFYNAAAYQDFDSQAMSLTKGATYYLVMVNDALGLTQDFIVRKVGYALNANYHLNKNIVFKSEFYATDFKQALFTNNFEDTGEQNNGLRLRAEFSFA